MIRAFIICLLLLGPWVFGLFVGLLYLVNEVETFDDVE